MKRTNWLLGSLALVLVVVGASAFIWSGAYNVAADNPHWPLTEWIMETARDRAIAAQASDVVVRSIDDESMIRVGAGNYDAMCVGCHLKPGVERSEASVGLYPAPPNLARRQSEDVARAFWIIKHGIKMSGMPAWGKSMDDGAIWGMVAFIEKLPNISETEYLELVESSEGHTHGSGDHEVHDGDAHDAKLEGEHAPVHVHDDGTAHEPQIDVPKEARAAAATVDRFFTALSAGDLKSAGAELDPKVIILESGGGEYSAAEYLEGHAKHDAEFLKTAHHKPGRRTARVSGGLAWVASESEVHVPKDGKPTVILSAETMVLQSTGTDWKIVHIHWSSRAGKSE